MNSVKSKSDFMELDTRIYNDLLDNVKNKHPLLKHFNIFYPGKVPISMMNAIYVGRIETVLADDGYVTFDCDKWKVSIDLIITTKDNPKVERRKLLKSTVVAVKEVLMRSGLDVSIRDIVFEYDNTNVIQQARISLIGYEYEVYKDKKDYLKICSVFDDIETK